MDRPFELELDRSDSTRTWALLSSELEYVRQTKIWHGDVILVRASEAEGGGFLVLQAVGVSVEGWRLSQLSILGEADSQAVEDFWKRCREAKR